jgi:hypothetical protein
MRVRVCDVLVDVERDQATDGGDAVQRVEKEPSS